MWLSPERVIFSTSGHHGASYEVRARGTSSYDARRDSGLVPPQPEGEAVEQGAPGGLDHVVADPDGDPGAGAVGGLDQHAGDRVGAVPLVEDADLVVDQLELHDLGVELLDRLAQRVVQGVDRAVALPDRDDARTASQQLHRRLGDRLVAG